MIVMMMDYLIDRGYWHVCGDWIGREGMMILDAWSNDVIWWGYGGKLIESDVIVIMIPALRGILEIVWQYVVWK